MRVWISSVVLLTALAVAGSAAARETEVFLSAQEGIESDIKAHLLKDVPVYMKGQKHPRVAKEIGRVSTNQSTRGAFRTDAQSCNVAFLSSLRALQNRCKADGGNAVIDIVSVTRGTTTESPTDFRCVAGSVIVHVGLRGTMVKLK